MEGVRRNVRCRKVERRLLRAYTQGDELSCLPDRELRKEEEYGELLDSIIL